MNVSLEYLIFLSYYKKSGCLEIMKNKYVKLISKLLFVVLCASTYAFFFKVIVEGRGFLAMGASGVAVILSRVLGSVIEQESISSLLYMIFYIMINLPLFIFGYKTTSKKFMLITILYVLTFSIVVGFIPETLGARLGFSELDDLTSAVLIGLISGFSCSAALLVGGCAGGLDIISTYLNVKKGKGVGVYNLIFNAGVIFVGLLIFKDIPSIIYTLVYAFFSSLIVDRYYNRNKKIMLEIVTTKKDEICKYLLENSHHGCTIMEAKGAYTNEPKYVIHTAISWFQLKTMTRAINKIDSNCFIINSSVYSVTGDFYMPPIK